MFLIQTSVKVTNGAEASYGFFIALRYYKAPHERHRSGYPVVFYDSYPARSK